MAGPARRRLAYNHVMPIEALIFDLDGTLVDSNMVHVEAWRRVFARHGYQLSPERIFPEVGKGGDNFVPALIGEEADKRDGDALRKAQPEEYAKIVKETGLKTFPGAVELLKALRRRGVRTALATSSNVKQLQTTEKAAGVKFTELVDVVVNADDAERSKPHPDLVHATLDKLRLPPDRCAMVGDTPHDAEAAKKAAVACVGVRCGGHDDATLRGAGCVVTYANPEDLLGHFEEALRLAEAD